jgi:5-hydroxyisourate hydrolase-like protein (transthyretin family)
MRPVQVIPKSWLSDSYHFPSPTFLNNMPLLNNNPDPQGPNALSRSETAVDLIGWSMDGSGKLARLVAGLTLLLLFGAGIRPAQAQVVDINYAYAIADSGDTLVRMNRFTGANFSVIGDLGTTNTEAMTWNHRGTAIYATDAGQFGTVNYLTGVFTAIGSGVGTGTGVNGSVAFDDVDGLCADPTNGIIYGSVRVDDSGSTDDVLIQINPTTGNFIPNAFGAGKDYVVLNASGLALTPILYDIDDIGVNPIDGQMFAVANNSGGNDHLVTVDKLTGAVTLMGQLRLADGTAVTDMEGYSFHNDGILYGTTGNASVITTQRNSLWVINKATGVVTLIGVFGSGSDYEAVGALHAGYNTVTGTVFGDVNRSALLDAGDFNQGGVTVRFYRDVNGDSLLDAGDILFNTAVTDGSGFYSFETASTGNFLTVVDTATLPAGSQLTTAGINTASFTTWGNVDPNNNFGFNNRTDLGDLVWNDLNGDGVQNGAEPGIQGVTVCLYTAAGAQVTSTVTNQGAALVGPATSTVTGASGSAWTSGVFTLPVNTVSTSLTLNYSQTDGGSSQNADFRLEYSTDGGTSWATATPIFDYPIGTATGAQTFTQPTLPLNVDRVRLRKNAGNNGDSFTLTNLTIIPTISVTTPICATTDSNGRYNIAIPSGIVTPGASYELRLATAQTPLNALLLSDANKGSDDALDSDATIVGASAVIPFTMPASGVANFTLDYAFGVRTALGNLVFNDVDGDGKYEPANGETGINGVKVQLFTSSNVEVNVGPDGIWGNADDTSGGMTTSGGGGYYFQRIAPGDYYVKVSASEFAVGKPLRGLISSSGGGSNDTTDDNLDENGIDNVSPSVNGIRSNTINLAGDAEPLAEAGRATTQADDNNSNLTVDLGFTCPALVVTQPSLLTATVGVNYSHSVGVSGGTGPYTFALTTSILPSGLGLNTGSGLISGVPTVVTSTNVTITATDSIGCQGTVSFTLSTVCPTLLLSSLPASLPDGLVGTPYVGGTISASGGSPTYTYSVVPGALPAGLSMSSAGEITGTPLGPVQVTSFLVSVVDQYGCPGSGTFNIGIGCSPMVVSPSLLSDGYVGTTYPAVTFSQTGGVGAVTWSVASGALPDGMNLNTETGVLSGTPTTPGLSSFAVMATDTVPCTGVVNLTLLVPAGNITGSVIVDAAPDLSGGSLLDGVVLTLYSVATGLPVDNPNVTGQQNYTVTTGPNGSYAFTNLAPGAYEVRETQPTDLLTVTDADTTSPEDDASNANGLDNSIPVSIVNGETDTGNSFFERSQLALGNLVFRDENGNGRFDGWDFGVNAVRVRLYTDAGVEVLVGADGVLGTGDDGAGGMLTSGGGHYYFTKLFPGDYYVQIPASEFALGKPLGGLVSVTGAGTDDTTDDNTDENGIDDSAPSINGIRSNTFTLTAGAEPTNEAGSSTGQSTDDNSNVTIDFGFRCPGLLENGSFEQGAAFVANASRLGGTDNAMIITRSSGNPVTGIKGNYFQPSGPEEAWWVDSSKAHDGNRYLQLYGVDNCLRVSEPSVFGVGSQLQNHVNYEICVWAANTEATPSVLRIEIVDYDGNDYMETYFTLDPKTLDWSEAVGNEESIPWQKLCTRFNLPSTFSPATTAIFMTVNNFDNTVPGAVLDSLTICPVLTQTVGLGNLVFIDSNQNGHADAGEGVNGVAVELFRKNGANYEYVADEVTASGGRFAFLGLDPGTYQLRVPAYEFGVGGDLAGSLYMADGLAGDDDVGENGVNAASPATTGIISGDVVLSLGGSPTSLTGEDGIASSADDYADADIDFTVDLGFTCPPITITQTSVPNGTVGELYSTVNFTSTGGVGALTWSVSEGALPAGVTLASTTGVLSGTPSVAGPYSFSITVQDSHQCSQTVELSLVIQVAPATISGSIFLGAQPGLPLTPINVATVELFFSNGDPVPNPNVSGSTNYSITTSNGTYAFIGLAPGSYVVRETQPSGYLTLTDEDSIADQNSSPTDPSNTNGADNEIAVIVEAGETDAGNDFVEKLILAKICGQLTIDVDGNGSGDVGYEDNTITVLNPITFEVYDTTTDDSGNYCVDDIPAGSYRVLSHRPTGYKFVGDADSATLGIITGITLTVGQTLLNQDFVIAAVGSISGSVFSIAVGDEMVALPDVSVKLCKANGDDVDGNPFIEGVQPYIVQTNFEGYYQFVNLDPADYQVKETQPDGYLSVGDADGGDPNFIGDVALVTVFALSDSPNQNFLETLGGTISGTVFQDPNPDEDGGYVPMSGVTLTLCDATSGDPVANPNTIEGEPYVVVTGTLGTYAFTGLPAANYVIKETQPAHFANQTQGDYTEDANSPDDPVLSPMNELMVNLAVGETDDGNTFVERPLLGIGNMVFLDNNGDGIFNGADAGINGVNVRLYRSTDDITTAAPVATDTTRNGGKYLLETTVPGSYRVVIAAGNFVMEAPLWNHNNTFGTEPNASDDDNAGENGIDTLSPETVGVMSGVITLGYGQQLTTETGHDASSDDAVDTHVNLTVDFGFVTPVFDLKGSVVLDRDSSSDFSESDTPIPSVTLSLYLDRGVIGQRDALDLLLGTQTSSEGGAYEFTNLPNGNYLVVEFQPQNATSVLDTGGQNDNLIPVVLAGEDSVDNDFLEAVDPQGYIYLSNSGKLILGGTINVTGPIGSNIIYTLDGSSGEYAWIETNGIVGTYTMTYAPPVGYSMDPTRPAQVIALDPTGQTSPYAIGSGVSGNPRCVIDYSAIANPWYDKFDLAPGDPMVVFNNLPLVSSKAISWAVWQGFNPLGGQNGPTDNPDGDVYDNLQEYAFCKDPSSGVNTSCPLEIVNTGAELNARITIGAAITDVIYTLEYISDLALSSANGGGWTPVDTISPSVIPNLDGTAILTYANLESIPALANGKGFVRLKVDLVNPVLTTRTYAVGWVRRNIAPACETYCNAFLACPVFSGIVDGNTATTLDITTAVGTKDFASNLIFGRSYYVEVVSGPKVGHRWQVNTVMSDTHTVALSTGTAVLTVDDLLGSRVIVRETQTLGGNFPPELYRAGSTPNNSDKILVYNPSLPAKWETYFLADLTAGGMGIHWINQNDGTAASQDGKSLDASAGIFIHRRAAPVAMVQLGQVRQNPLVAPLSAGSNLVGAGYPVNQSYVGRGMNWTGASFGGFTGNVDPVRSDTVLFWKGDTTFNAENYTTHWLVNAGFDPYRRWSLQGDNAINSQDLNKVFKVARATFYKVQSANPNYIMPTGWIP